MPVEDYTPEVAQVAGFIRARTRTAGGTLAGTFNPAADDGTSDQTVPNAEGVEEIIATAVGKVSGKIGVDIAEVFQPDAKRLVALYTAMLTELDYWPEQINTGRSTYPQLKELWDEEWEEFLDLLGIGEQPGGGPPDASAGYPSGGGFPTTAVGMETAW